MAAPPAAVDVAELIAKLKARELALGDPLNVPRTTRAFADYWAMRRELAATLSALANLLSDIACEQQKLDDLDARRALMMAQQGEIDLSRERIERLRAQLAVHVQQAEVLLGEPATS